MLLPNSKLWFIVAITNPIHFHRRIELYHQFRDHIVNEVKGNLITIEGAYKSDDFFLDYTSTENDLHYKVRYNSILWLKESLQNRAAEYLPSNAEYICFLDADVKFLDPVNVQHEIVTKLQNNVIVQPWKLCYNLGKNNEVLEIHRSFIYGLSQISADDRMNLWTQGHPYHPGYGIAFRKDFFDKIPGLLDFAILGSADAYMMRSFINDLASVIHFDFTEEYKLKLLRWQNQLQRVLSAEKFSTIGYADLQIEHFYHGSKQNRFYIEREAILIDEKFDPLEDCISNQEKIIELKPRVSKENLEDKIISYFMIRNEDE